VTQVTHIRPVLLPFIPRYEPLAAMGDQRLWETTALFLPRYISNGALHLTLDSGSPPGAAAFGALIGENVFDEQIEVL
jgi:hypothetical protein